MYQIFLQHDTYSFGQREQIKISCSTKSVTQWNKVFNRERFSGTKEYWRISDDQDKLTVNANVFTDIRNIGRLREINYININIKSCSIREPFWKVNHPGNVYIQGKKYKLVSFSKNFLWIRHDEKVPYFTETVRSPMFNNIHKTQLPVYFVYPRLGITSISKWRRVVTW